MAAAFISSGRARHSYPLSAHGAQITLHITRDSRLAGCKKMALRNCVALRSSSPSSLRRTLLVTPSCNTSHGERCGSMHDNRSMLYNGWSSSVAGTAISVAGAGAGAVISGAGAGAVISVADAGAVISFVGVVISGVCNSRMEMG